MRSSNRSTMPFDRLCAAGNGVRRVGPRQRDRPHRRRRRRREQGNFRHSDRPNPADIAPAGAGTRNQPSSIRRRARADPVHQRRCGCGGLQPKGARRFHERRYRRARRSPTLYDSAATDLPHGRHRRAIRCSRCARSDRVREQIGDSAWNSRTTGLSRPARSDLVPCVAAQPGLEVAQAGAPRDRALLPMRLASAGAWHSQRDPAPVRDGSGWYSLYAPNETTPFASCCPMPRRRLHCHRPPLNRGSAEDPRVRWACFASGASPSFAMTA